MILLTTPYTSVVVDTVSTSGLGSQRCTRIGDYGALYSYGPQRCARIGGYGAFLLEDPDKARTIVETLVANLHVPITAKIRSAPFFLRNISEHADGERRRRTPTAKADGEGRRGFCADLKGKYRGVRWLTVGWVAGASAFAVGILRHDSKKSGRIVKRRLGSILPNVAETIAFARMLEDAGIAAIAVHGRLREQRHHEGAADWWANSLD